LDPDPGARLVWQELSGVSRRDPEWNVAWDWRRIALPFLQILGRSGSVADAKPLS
jgi:hypothetical protein